MKTRVAKLREEKGLTVVDFAKACEVSRQTIHAIESEKFKPTVVLALKIAKVLNSSVEEIFILEKGD